MRGHLDRQRELADAIEGPVIDAALSLVDAVHEHGGPRDVAMILAGVPAEHRDALVVVLAAMVDPSRSIKDLLGWVNWTLAADDAAVA